MVESTCSLMVVLQQAVGEVVAPVPSSCGDGGLAGVPVAGNCEGGVEESGATPLLLLLGVVSQSLSLLLLGDWTPPSSLTLQ